MQFLMSLLGSVSISLLQQGYEIGLDWLGQFVRAIIESVGIIGVGIICFTLILKAITLPFDIYQRVKTRKQSLIMRSMKDDLDKLQKQYANDKTLYNQKMMELYKKNGYGMFGACLPMLISFIIIIVAFQAFNAYSRYANLNFFVQMSEDYNAAILANGVQGIDYSIVRDDANTVIVGEDGSVTLTYTDAEGTKHDQSVQPGSSFQNNGCVYTVSAKGNIPYYLSVVPEDDSKYIFYGYNLEETNISKEYSVDTEKLLAYLQANDEAAYQQINEAQDKNSACLSYVKGIGASAAKSWYDNHRANFLWVENVWYPDVSYNHPIPQDYATFQKNFGNVNVTLQDGTTEPLQNIFSEQNYNDLTAGLSAEKQQANGYFGLIILSIGLMVLSQFVMMRSQKEANKYQTVDGQGARTQKVMLIMMPLIYAIFAFMYSAAFTIYMLISSLFSLLVTLLSNLILGRIFNKKEEKAVIEINTNSPKWLQEKKAREREENKKNDKKNR